MQLDRFHQREREILLGEISEYYRWEYYKWNNKERIYDGYQLWYIFTREEIGSVGLILPYSLVIHPDHMHIKKEIKEES